MPRSRDHSTDLSKHSCCTDSWRDRRSASRLSAPERCTTLRVIPRLRHQRMICWPESLEMEIWSLLNDWCKTWLWCCPSAAGWLLCGEQARRLGEPWTLLSFPEDWHIGKIPAGSKDLRGDADPRLPPNPVRKGPWLESDWGWQTPGEPLVDLVRICPITQGLLSLLILEINGLWRAVSPLFEVPWQKSRNWSEPKQHAAKVPTTCWRPLTEMKPFSRRTWERREISWTLPGVGLKTPRKVSMRAPRWIMTWQGTREDFLRLMMKPIRRWSLTLASLVLSVAKGEACAWKLSSMYGNIDMVLKWRWAPSGANSCDQAKRQHSPLVNAEDSMQSFNTNLRNFQCEALIGMWRCPWGLGIPSSDPDEDPWGWTPKFPSWTSPLSRRDSNPWDSVLNRNHRSSWMQENSGNNPPPPCPGETVILLHPWKEGTVCPAIELIVSMKR